MGNITTFGQTEDLVIAGLNLLGVEVYQDPNSSEYYVLECSKDGRYDQLFHTDIGSLCQDNEKKITQFCANFEKRLMAKAPFVQPQSSVYIQPEY